ncbi:MAG: type III polyketide synthase [Pseudomonadota bacterium]
MLYLHAMIEAYLNLIATAVPEHDVHSKFVAYAPQLLKTEKNRAVFKRMSERSQIDHRYSFLRPNDDPLSLDADDFYRPGAFPDTATRMHFYQRHAFSLACLTLDKLGLADRKQNITHIIVTTCTGFYAPGLDLQIINHYGLDPAIERTVIGFMGCYAAINALKLARHIVRSEASAQVLILNLELCTLHLKEDVDLEQILSFLIFADGCSASLVSADPTGLKLKSFHAAIIPDSGHQITWNIGAIGFDMMLSGEVPATIGAGLPSCMNSILNGQRMEDIQHWAVHPGGRTVLDAVEKGAALPEGSLRISRDVLRRFGNMSSATIMFVLHEMMQRAVPSGDGCALAFGPGLTVESMMFEKVES